MLRPYNDVDLHAFVDGQVSPDRKAAINAYLAVTPEDAARVDGWTKQNASVRALFAAPAKEPVPLWLTVGQIAAARTTRDDHGRAVDTPPRRSERSRTEKAGANPSRTAAAFIVLAFTAGLVVASAADRLSRWAGWEPLAAAASGRGVQQRAWEAHETFGLDPDRPVDVSDVAPGRVQAWLDSRVPFHTRVPDLQTLGWTLLGGRLTPGDAGPGALLVYRDAVGDRLSVFSGRAANQSGDVVPAAAEAHGILSWTDNAVGYAVLTSKGRTWLDRHAAALKQAILADESAEN